MHIAALEVRSYKSFLRPAVIPLSPSFNIFIGPNNCGKTNILDAIDFLAHPDKNPARLHHHRAQLLMSVRLDAAEQKKTAADPLVTMEGRQYSVTAEKGVSGKAAPFLKYLAAKVKMLTYEDFSDLESIERDYTSLAQKYPQRFKEFTELLQEHFPEVQDIRAIADVDSDSYGSVTVGTNTITLDRLGGGFRRVLVILLYALHPVYSVLLIDEPEIHLHPGMIKRVLRILMSGKTNQCIVTTHSPLFVTAETLPFLYRVLKDQEGSHVYSLAQHPSALDRQRLVQELNADNMEMFFADKVLLVEGVSDRILMRGLIDRFYQGPLDIKVIFTHGKTNIESYIQIMTIFHIPYLVMLDRDAQWALAEQFGLRKGPAEDMREEFLRRHLVILDNGSIEQNYPHKYQVHDSKPRNALVASQHVTEAEYRGPVMKNLRQVIELL